MRRSEELIKKIQQIESLLSELKLELQEVIQDEINCKKEVVEEEEVKDEEPSLGGIRIGDRVKFLPTNTTRGGYGVVKSWTSGKDPFLRIERENATGNRIVLRKPHKVSHSLKNGQQQRW